MNEQQLEHFVGLDVGTSKVRCIVGVATPNEPGKPSVIGYGSASNSGMRKGCVIYADEVADAIAEAVSEAERISGVNIDRATVNVNGSHVVGSDSKGVVAISSVNREITEEDRARVEEAATIVQLPPNREIVQVFAKNYRLDGQENIKDPVGMQGVRLEVDTHIVTAAIPNLRNLDTALEKAQIVPNRHTISSLAAAEVVLSRQQKEAGTAVIDIGAGTTNLLIMEDGEVQHVAVLPIGGIHITNDLAIGLKTDLDVAEQVKIEFAHLTAEAKKLTVSLNVNSVSHNFTTSDIKMITEARVEELLEYIDKELKKAGKARKLPGGIVLTGGTANLPGLAEFTRDKLQLAARIGKLQTVSGLVDSLGDPATFTAIGLMLLDMLLLPAHPSSQIPKTNTKILTSLTKLMRSARR